MPDESSEDGVVHELQELDGHMSGSAAVCVQGEEQSLRNTALLRASANRLRV